jgi:hypothetical protein
VFYFYASRIPTYVNYIRKFYLSFSDPKSNSVQMEGRLTMRSSDGLPWSGWAACHLNLNGDILSYKTDNGSHLGTIGTSFAKPKISPPTFPLLVRLKPSADLCGFPILENVFKLSARLQFRFQILVLLSASPTVTCRVCVAHHKKKKNQRFSFSLQTFPNSKR